MTPKIEFHHNEREANIRVSCLDVPATVTWPDKEPKRAILMVDIFGWFNALTADEVTDEAYEGRREEIEAVTIRLFEKPEPPLQTPRGDYQGKDGFDCWYEILIPVPETVA
jgi:hypothetical protein